MSDANKDEGEDGDVTQEEIDDARNLSRKAVLCGIMHQVDKEPRYDFTPEFMEYLAITGEVLNENPEPVKKLTAESLENDFHFFQTIISRFLAYNRVFERKTAGLNNWQKFTVVISNQEFEITKTKRETTQQVLCLGYHISILSSYAYYSNISYIPSIGIII
jgi:hypothetical protein